MRRGLDIFSCGGASPNGSHWLWSRALAIPKAAQEPDAALKFALWTSSKEYIKLAAEDGVWVRGARLV
jgi:polyol transport system substrate-binding protein